MGMGSQYVVVYQEREHGRYETKFHVVGADSTAIDVATRFANGHNTKVDRIFSFNEYGNVTHYGMVLEGFKLKLKAIPKSLPHE